MLMKFRKLEKGLSDALENFKEQIKFDLDTFEQSHQDKYLKKDDLEEIGRQVYYCLSDFKERITEYLKEASRQ